MTATCPECGLIGVIDEDQADGDVSMICPSCGWHGYIDEVEDESGQTGQSSDQGTPRSGLGLGSLSRVVGVG